MSVHNWTNAQGCTVSYSPSSYAITVQHDPHGTGALTVDLNPTPATYGGTAVTEWSAAMTTACPDGSGGTVPVTIAGGPWFAGSGTLAPDGLSFTGSSTNLGQTFDYSFTRP